LKLISSRC